MIAELQHSANHEIMCNKCTDVDAGVGGGGGGVGMGVFGEWVVVVVGGMFQYKDAVFYVQDFQL